MYTKQLVYFLVAYKISSIHNCAWMLHRWVAAAVATTTDDDDGDDDDDDDGVCCLELVMSSIGAELSWLIGRARQDIMTNILV